MAGNILFLFENGNLTNNITKVLNANPKCRADMWLHNDCYLHVNHVNGKSNLFVSKIVLKVVQELEKYKMNAGDT